MKKQIVSTVMIMSLAIVTIGCSSNSNNDTNETTTTIQQEITTEETTTIKEVEQDTSKVVEVPSTEEPTTVVEEPTTEQPTVALTIAEANGITPTDTTKYTTSSLFVRGDASVSSELLGKLEMNDKVHVTGDVGNGWKRIDYNGSVGYVSGEYLSDSIIVVESTEKQTEKKTEKPTEKQTEKKTEKPTQQVVQQETTTKVSGGSSFSGEIAVDDESYEEWRAKLEQELKDGGVMDEDGNIIVPSYNISSGNSSGSSEDETQMTIPDFPGFE